MCDWSRRAWGAAVGAGAAAFLFGKVWGSEKRVKRLKQKCDEDLMKAFNKAKKKLENMITLYDTEVIVYQELIKKGQTTIKKLEDTLYHLPDVNNDNLIDRREFDDYMVKYRKMHPNLKDEDIPLFEDMDHNKDGKITFKGMAGYESRQLYHMSFYPNTPSPFPPPLNRMASSRMGGLPASVLKRTRNSLKCAYGILCNQP